MAGLNQSLQEEMRYTRVDRPGRRWLLRIVNVVKAMSALVLVTLMLAGIGLIVYGQEQSTSTVSDVFAKTLWSSHSIGNEEVAELTPERIALLLSFSSRHSGENPTIGHRHTGVEFDSTEASGYQKTEADSNAELSQSLAGTVELELADARLPTAASEFSSSPLAGVVELKFDDAALIMSSFTPPTTVTQIVPADTQLLSTELRGFDDTSSSASTKESVTLPTTTSAGLQNELWILQQDPDSFLIVVGSTVNKAFLRKFLDPLPGGINQALYSLRLNDKDDVVYALCVGGFTSRQNANDFLAGMSSKAKRYGAFVIGTQSVQSGIANFRQTVAHTGSGFK